MTFLTLLEYNGAALGILGALLVVSQSAKTRAIAFAVWTVSNLSLITLFVATKQYGLLGMQGFFLFTSGLGLLNNLRAMRKPVSGTSDLVNALARERKLSLERAQLLGKALVRLKHANSYLDAFIRGGNPGDNAIECTIQIDELVDEIEAV